MGQAEQDKLGGMLDRDKLWKKVGEKIFQGSDGEEVKQNQLADIENDMSGCGLQFLEYLKANKASHNVTWGAFLQKCEDHEIYGIDSTFSLEENESFKDKKLSTFDLTDREKIGRKLDILRRWKKLAVDEFKMKKYIITGIEVHGQNQYRVSFTESLLTLIWQIKPDLILRDLAQACWDVQNARNAVEYLREIGKQKYEASVAPQSDVAQFDIE